MHVVIEYKFHCYCVGVAVTSQTCACTVNHMYCAAQWMTCVTSVWVLTAEASPLAEISYTTAEISTEILKSSLKSWNLGEILKSSLKSWNLWEILKSLVKSWNLREIFGEILKSSWNLEIFGEILRSLGCGRGCGYARSESGRPGRPHALICAIYMRRKL